MTDIEKIPSLVRSDIVSAWLRRAQSVTSIITRQHIIGACFAKKYGGTRLAR